MKAKDERRQIETMEQWVDTDDNADSPIYIYEPAEVIARRMTTAELLRDHSAITVRLCGPLSDKPRETWDRALSAICDVLGARIDAANDAAHYHGTGNE